MGSFFRSCERYFGAKNLYEVLGIEKDASADKVKKAYYRLSLKVHPDRVPTSEKVDATEKFQILGKVYSVLSDKEKRLLYDQTGVIEEYYELNNETDWYAYWRLLFKLSEEDIKCFEKRYKESGEELTDLKAAYLEFEGDMEKILENVLCCTADDEERFRETLELLITKGKMPSFEAFSNESTRKMGHRKRKAKQEAKEAEEMKEQLFKDASIKADSSEDALVALIQKRQGQREESLLANLEAKYCQPKKNKKGSKSGKGKK